MTKQLSMTERVYAAIQSYTQAENPSSFLAVNDGNSVFTDPGLPGVVVYRRVGDYIVQFGGPFAPPESYGALLDSFLRMATQERCTVVAVQLQRADAEIYREHGYTVNQIGASYAVELKSFTLRGTKFMQLRNKISRAFRYGITVVEADYGDWADGIGEIDTVWLGSKGEHARPLTFLVGQMGGQMQEHRRLFVALCDGELAGYISYSPVYGSRAGWMHDLSRRRPDGPPGVMEAINRTAIETFQSEGVDWLHFGFTPFTSLTPDVELPGHDLAFAWLMGHLWEHGAAIYPAQTQLAYKEKWAPTAVLTEYVAFLGKADIGSFVHIFRAANAL